MADKVRSKPRSDEDKRAILSEIGVNGATTKTVAEKHGLSEAALYNWKSKAKKTAKPGKRRAKKKTSAKAAARAALRETAAAARGHANGKAPHQLDVFAAQLSSYVTTIIVSVVRQELQGAILALAQRGAVG
jgi:transposase-like protein